MMRSFEHNIVRRDFDIALLHIYGLDDAKHGNGIHGEKIDGYLRRYDAFLGRLMHYCDTRSNENITLIATGDHGQKNVTWAIYGNMLLADMGLVTYEMNISAAIASIWTAATVWLIFIWPMVQTVSSLSRLSCALHRSPV